MNITIYSHEAFIRLICCCIVLGFVSGIIYCIISAVSGIRFVYQYRDFRSVKTFLSDNYVYCSENGKLSDFISLVLIAVSSLLASFVSNSGSFRLLIVPILLLGFVSAVLLLKRITVLSVYYSFIIIKRLLGMAVLPFSFVIKKVIGACKRCIAIIQKRHKSKIVARYTEKRFKDIDLIKQSGLLDPRYEVV